MISLVSLLWLLAGLGLLLPLYYLVVYPYCLSPLRGLPGPRDHHWLLGHCLHQFRSGSPEEPFETWMRQWPSAPLIRYYEAGMGDAVLVCALEPYRELMQSQCYAFERTRPFRRLIGDIIGEGVVFAEGDTHRFQRKAMGGLFTVANVKSYLPLLLSKSDDLADEIGRLCVGGRVEVKDVFSRMMLDVIGFFTLGIDLGHLGPDALNPTAAEFLRCYRTVFDLSPAGMTLAAVNLLVPVRWMPLAENRSFMEASASLRHILADMVDERTAAVAAGTWHAGTPTDLLTYLLQHDWARDDLVEQMLNFMATGHETTASALTWASFALGQHPAVLQKLRAEAATLPAVPAFADIEGLPYLDHFLREVVRVYCPVAGIPRVAIRDVVLAGQVLPKGTTVLPVPCVLQHNPAIWGPDAAVFRPERWERVADKKGGNNPVDNPLAWVAFGHGPRACIGKALAALSFKTAILAVVRRFDLEAEQERLEVVNPSGQLRPLGGVWMKVKEVEEVKEKV